MKSISYIQRCHLLAGTSFALQTTQTETETETETEGEGETETNGEIESPQTTRCRGDNQGRGGIYAPLLVGLILGLQELRIGLQAKTLHAGDQVLVLQLLAATQTRRSGRLSQNGRLVFSQKTPAPFFGVDPKRNLRAQLFKIHPNRSPLKIATVSFVFLSHVCAFFG